MRFFAAIIGIILGLLYLKYNFQITRLLGPFATVEQYLGPGSTYGFHKIIALIIIIGSIMWALGTFQSALQQIVGPFFNAN
jgi:cell division protein FtsX